MTTEAPNTKADKTNATRVWPANPAFSLICLDGTDLAVHISTNFHDGKYSAELSINPGDREFATFSPQQLIDVADFIRATAIWLGRPRPQQND